MPNANEHFSDLLDKLTVKYDVIKEQAISLVREAIPGATEVEFTNLSYDDHAALSMTHDVCAYCNVVFMLCNRTFTVRFGAWPEPLLTMTDVKERTTRVRLMSDILFAIGNDILHLDKKLTPNLDGRFVIDKYESKPGDDLIICGTYNDKDGNAVATLRLSVYEDLEHAGIEVLDNETLITTIEYAGVFHDDYSSAIDESIESYRMANTESNEAPEGHGLDWDKIWERLEDDKETGYLPAYKQLAIFLYPSIAREMPVIENPDDGVLFKYRGIEFTAKFGYDDDQQAWYIHVEATDGVRDGGNHNIYYNNGFADCLDTIVDTRDPVEVAKPADETPEQAIFKMMRMMDSGDLERSFANLSTNLNTVEILVKEFFARYYPFATITEEKLESDSEGWWIEVYFKTGDSMTYHLDFILDKNGAQHIKLWAEDSNGFNIESKEITDANEFSKTLQLLDNEVLARDTTKPKELTDHERIIRLEEAVKVIQAEIVELKKR